MSREFREEFKKKEENPEVKVFSAFHSDIKKTGVSQCKVHEWRERNERELECTKCFTVIIIK